jgi:uncharacterized protein (DUF849 family)
MARPTILTCAVTGNLTKREQNPALPVTPAEIAASAVEASRAGAAIVHLHARDPRPDAARRAPSSSTRSSSASAMPAAT